MAISTVRVEPSDTLNDLISAVEAADEQHVLLVMPWIGRGVLSERVDMARLKRHADHTGKTVGVVSSDPRVHANGRNAKLPVYYLSARGKRQLHKKRPWWLPIESRSGKRSSLSESDRRTVHRRRQPKPRLLRYSYRYVVLFSFFIVLALVAIAGIYTLPQATVTLKPVVLPLSISQQIVADPRVSAADASGATVPGRLLVYVDSWRANVDTSGYAEVAVAPARGLVTFVNRVPQNATIPIGTRVSTSTGERIIFQTTKTVELPPTIGAEIDVEVVAIELGTKGNLPADRINRVEGALAPQLNVRNLFQMSGGSSRFAGAVTVEDKERLKEHVSNTLMENARVDMRTNLADGEILAEDSVRWVFTYLETYSHFVNEETPQLTLEVRAEIHGTAVDEALANQLVFEEMQRSVPQGFSIMEETIQPQTGGLLGVDEQGRVAFEMLGEAFIVADMSLREPLNAIVGQETIRAQYFLDEELPLAELPEIRVWPALFGRMPYAPARIYTNIETGIELKSE
ncbi:MAG: baseplate J/gp47 family protein [Candidatus Promineifilaceae bacterium]